MPRYAPIKLLENATTNVTGEALDFPGGEAVFAAYGTFDGAQVGFEYSMDGTIWEDLRGPYDPDGTTIVDIVFEFCACKVRSVITNAGASTDITAEIRHTGSVE